MTPNNWCHYQNSLSPDIALNPGLGFPLLDLKIESSSLNVLSPISVLEDPVDD